MKFFTSLLFFIFIISITNIGNAENFFQQSQKVSKVVNLRSSLVIHSIYNKCYLAVLEETKNKRIAMNVCFCITDWKRTFFKKNITGAVVKKCTAWTIKKILNKTTKKSPFFLKYKSKIGLSTRDVMMSLSACVFGLGNSLLNPIDVCSCYVDAFLHTGKTSIKAAVKHTPKVLMNHCNSLKEKR